MSESKDRAALRALLEATGGAAAQTLIRDLATPIGRAKVAAREALAQPDPAEQLAQALQSVMQLLDDGVLVRNINDDGRPDWAIRMLPLVSTLATARAALAAYEASK